MKSGTKYIYKALNNVGVKIGHEKPKQDGLIGYSFIMQNPKNYEFIIQQTREPLKSISSAARYGKYWFEICEPHLGLTSEYPILCERCKAHGIRQKDGCGMRHKEDYICKVKILRAMRYWYCMSKKAEALSSWRYKVEDYISDQRVRGQLHRFAGASSNKEPLEWNANPGSYIILNWQILESIDSDLTKMIQDKAIKYGYSIISS